jgi:hypothetical protein
VAIKEQLSALTAQVSAVVALASTLEAQHAAAQDTIRGLEGKVEALESLLRQQIVRTPLTFSSLRGLHADDKYVVIQQQQQQAAAPVTEKESTPQPSPPEEKPAEKESLTDRITEWMKNVEGKWNTVQEEWNQERERLGRAREEWESKVRLVDSNLQKLANANASTSAGGYGRVGGVYVNGDVVKHNGLVTPPSPRSQSSDSGRYRRRRRRNREGRRESEGESSGSEEEERSPSPAARRAEAEAERSATEVNGKEREETSESTAPTSAASSLGVVTGAFFVRLRPWYLN